MSSKTTSDAGEAARRAPVTFARSKSRRAQGFVLSGVLTAVGLATIVLSGGLGESYVWTGGLLVVLGLVFLVQAIRTSRDTAPWLVIDARGLWYKEWGLPPVPWPEIADLYQTGSRFQAFLAVALRDQEAYFAGLAERGEGRVRPGRLIRPGLLLIPANTLDSNFRQVQIAIERIRTSGPDSARSA